MSDKNLWLTIPIEIVEDDRLNSAQMILYSLIFSGREGHDDGYYCQFENSYSSRVMNISESSILIHLDALERCGHIERQVIRRETTNEVIEQRIYLL